MKIGKSIVEQRHVQVKKIMEQELLDGTYPYKGRLPTTKVLSEKYGVSGNVVTQAIDLLRKQKLVKAKVGSGIYSRVDAPDDSNINQELDLHRAFIPDKKCLTIWIEDPLPWQKAFWNRTFKRFLDENIDIEVQLRFGLDTLESDETPDMILGSLSYLNNSSFGFDDLMDDTIINEFYPDLYANMLFTPETLTWKGSKILFPFSFIHSFVACHRQNWKDEYLSCNNYFDLFDQAETTDSPSVIYDLWTIMNPLITQGCFWTEGKDARFSINDSKTWRQFLMRLKELYLNNQVNWPLKPQDSFANGDLVKTLKEKVLFKEINMQIEQSISDNKELVIFPCPFDKYFFYNPANAFVMKHTIYPEECLRLLSLLLTRNIQQDLLESKVGFCIDKEILSVNHDQFSNKIQKAHKVFCFPPDKLIHLIVNEILVWEIYHYINERVPGDILDRIKKKVRYFYKNTMVMPLSVLSKDNSKRMLSKYLMKREKTVLNLNTGS